MEGTIYKLLEIKQGVSKTGKSWKARDVIVSIKGGSFLALTAWNETTDLLKGAKPGDDVEFEFSVKSREFSGKWYTECNLTRLHISSVFSDTHDEEPEPPDNDLPF